MTMIRRSNAKSSTLLLAHALLVLLAAVSPAGAQPRFASPGDWTNRTEYVPDELKNVAVDEHAGTTLPLDLPFRDEQDQPVALRQFFTGKKPVILQLGYYQCPMLCDLVSKGLLDSLEKVKLDAGKDFEVVFVSIDPHETPALAALKKQSYVREYGRSGGATGWHFLTGQAEQISQLSKAVGFNFKWVPAVRQFSHPAVLTVCTPDGRLSRYLYGVQFEPKTLRLSVVEASDGKVGSAMDQIFLTCFQYDGHQGKYAFAAMGLMRAGGILTIIIVATSVYRMLRREQRLAANDNES